MLVAPSPSYASSETYGISPSGLIVGQFRVLNSSRGPGFLRLTTGKLVPIRAQFSTAKVMPLSVNDSMQVVGIWTGAGFPSDRGFWWTPQEGMVDIGSLYPSSQTWALSVNSHGQVAGWSQKPGGQRAFLWTLSGGMTEIDPWPGYPQCESWAVNESGDVLVHSDGNFMIDHTHVKMSDGSLREIPQVTMGFGLAGQSMNGRGDVAGYADIGGGLFRAFVSPVGGASVLIQDHLEAGSQGWTLLNANSINDEGWIVGAGKHGGPTHGYLAVPTTNQSHR
jgi:uncharacterized membrane protein